MRPTSMRSFPIHGAARALSVSSPAPAASTCVATSHTTSPQLSVRPTVEPQYARMHGAVDDGGTLIRAIDVARMNPKNLKQIVDYKSDQLPGAVVVDPKARFLYFILEGGKAMRYGVGVGKAGLEFQGEADVARKASWPGWTPTSNMIERDPERYEPWARGMEGGIPNPLGSAGSLSLPKRSGHVLPNPRHERAVVDRLGSFVGLHPSPQPGQYRS
ncbi:MAG: hypothetical protein FD144_5871 [Rhodospirillaceae bacterium]|nr:MAG: hypothetical protein FD144_5871 [Rhodospirillaceae bacterium]